MAPGVAPGMAPARGPPPTGAPPRGAPGMPPGMQALGVPPGSPRWVFRQFIGGFRGGGHATEIFSARKTYVVASEAEILQGQRRRLGLAYSTSSVLLLSSSRREASDHENAQIPCPVSEVCRILFGGVACRHFAVLVPTASPLWSQRLEHFRWPCAKLSQAAPPRHSSGTSQRPVSHVVQLGRPARGREPCCHGAVFLDRIIFFHRKGASRRHSI